MTTDEAVAIAKVALRDPNHYAYPLTDVSEAIRFVLGELARLTRVTRATDTIAIGSGVSVLDLSTLNDTHTFSAERITGAPFWIDGDPVELVNIEKVRELHVKQSDATGQPTQVTFTDEDNIQFWPTTDATCTLSVIWSPYYDETDSTINIPDRYIRPAIMWGVPAFLRYAGREEMNASPMWLRFMEYVHSIKRSVSFDPGIVKPDTRKFL